MKPRRVDIDGLIGDIRERVLSKPRKLDWHQIRLHNLGQRLLEFSGQQYVKEEVASWKLKLEPRENHFDKRITVTTPLSDAGVYLVTATLPGGKKTRILLWLTETSIIRKPVDSGYLYYLADAVTGSPLSGVAVEFLGFQWKHQGKDTFGRHRKELLTEEFRKTTDEKGQIRVSSNEMPRGYQWLVTAKTSTRSGSVLGLFSFVESRDSRRPISAVKGVWDYR